jgi:alpha-2-macroglobulin
MSHRTSFKVLELIVLFSLLLSSCKPAASPVTVPAGNQTTQATQAASTRLPQTDVPQKSQPAATLAPTQIPVLADFSKIWSQAGAVPPQVVSYLPVPGGEVHPTATFEIRFDQPMDTNTTQSAFQVTGPDGQALKGTYAWPSQDHLVFQPTQPLKAGSNYEAVLDASAASHSGTVLSRPFSYSVTTITPLQVTQVFPSQSTQDVDPASRLTVMFNRPVVPLGIQEEQSSLPQPLVILPEVKGQGEWINTSVYVFTPAGPLKTGTQYTVTLKAGLKDATGDDQVKLADDYQWQFTTRQAGILRLSAGNYSMDVSELTHLLDVPPTAAITVEFLQPMDSASTARAIDLRSTAGKVIAFNPQWDKDNRLLTIKPLQNMGMNTNYQLTIGKNAHAADGGTLADKLEWTFTTTAVPGILETIPADKSFNAETQFTIRFLSQMDTKTILDHVVFKPEVKKLTWWYNGATNEAYFYGLEASTVYEVTIQAGMLDHYGNAINTTKVVHFKTAPLQPYASLRMPYAPLYREGGTQDFYLAYVNVQSIDLKLYRLTDKEYIRNFEGKVDVQSIPLDKKTLVWSKTVKSSAALNEFVNEPISLNNEDGSPLTPGYYYLTMDCAQISHTGSYLESRSLVLTQTYLTFKNSPGDALVWATDPQSGKPVSGIHLHLVDGDLNSLGDSVTDTDGLVHFTIPIPEDGSFTSRFVISDSAAGTGSNAGQFAFASSGWDSGVYPEMFGIQQYFSQSPFQTTAYVYTDRPIYRPGQPVYFKGILRQDDDLAYHLPTMKEVEISISSYEQEISRQTLSLDEFGTFNGEIDLDSEAVLGAYTINIKPVGKDSWLGGINFSVAEYRKPEFQIDLQAAPKNVASGDDITADLSASYYSGGPLSDASVDWTLRSDPFNYQPSAEYSRFSFYDDSRDSGVEADQPQEDRGKIIAEGSGTIGKDGKLSWKIPADLANATASRSLTLETTINDLAGSTVSAQAQVVAHKARVYAGARPGQYVGMTGEEQSFELAALDWDGKPVAAQKLDVEIVRREWYSVQEEDAQGVLRWKTSVKDVPVSQFSDIVVDEKGLATVKFTPQEGGVYRALVKATDVDGHTNQAAAYLWVSGSDFIPWRQSNDRTFQLVADRDSYKPGDTAELLIASPFQGSTYALITVERGKVRSQKVTQLTTNSTVYRLPITPDMAPGVFVSVTVIKGVDDTNPRPGFKVGMAKLNVSTDQQALKIDLVPDKKDAGPGDSVTFQVKVTNAAGKGVPAEVSLGLSDLATLSLASPNSLPILNYFYGERGLSVSTALSISASIEDFNAELQKNLEQGHSAGSGGGKGDDSLGVPEVRQNFPDTAFWKADLVTDAAGNSSVTVTLPDNLTTWRLDGRAVTADTLVGQSTVDIISSRPLLVRPQTPRFFVAGDDAVLSAAVHNNTGKTLEVKVGLDATGVELKDPAEQTITLETGTQKLVIWRTHVPADSQRVDLVFRAKGGDFQDASRPTLGTLDNQGIPVYRYEAPETVGTAGELPAQGARVEGIRLPTNIDVTSGQLKVQVEPSLAAGMVAGLDYLEHYPYECTEQTISRFLPNILTLRALQAAGVDDPALKANLNNQLATGLQKLYNHQNSDGGWGWWAGSKSDPLTSTYVLLALVEVKQADYPLDQTVFERALYFLSTNATTEFSILKSEASVSRNRMTFQDYVLTRAGQPDVSRTGKMFDQRKWLDLYSLGFLAQTLYLIDPKDPRLANLRDELVNAASLSATGAHWQEHSSDPWNWSSDTRSTAIVLDTLIQIDPGNAINTNAVRWLMLARQDGHWASTQETAWSLKALVDWLILTKELKADYVFAVSLNGKDIAESRVSPSTVREARTVITSVQDLIKDQTNQLSFARTDGPGSMYYTTHLTVDLPVPAVKALDQGIVLSRSYFRPDDLKHPVTQASQGDVLQAKLTIVVPKDLHFVVIDDPLPAGLEAVDTTLKSSPQNEAPQYDWSSLDKDGWGWWYFTHSELRDEKVVLSADYLPAGTYVYTYQVRASTPGSFQVIPPTGQEFYLPEVNGRGDGSLFVVKR